jgi:Ca-activated chloride channel family protein
MAAAMVLLCATLDRPLHGEQQAGSLPAFGERISVQWILVPVVVRVGDRYVRDLEVGDFRLFVDGLRVEIESFERGAEAPVSLVFLQDLSGSMAVGGRLEASQEALFYFLERVRPEDEISLASFAGRRTYVEVPFTSDRTALNDAVAAWRAYGTTALHDAIAWLPEISLDGRNPKRGAILITDGADNDSSIDPGRAREMVRQAEIPVYVLGLDTVDRGVAGANGSERYRYAQMLKLLAHHTGGRYYSIPGPDGLKEACVSLTEDLSYQYVLGFSTLDSGRVSYRELGVEVRGRGKSVFSRQGYQGFAPRTNRMSR